MIRAACRRRLRGMQTPRNIAARAGRWSARHRKTAILGWIAFVVLAVFAGQSIGTNTLTQEQSGVGESGAANRIVDKAYPDKVEELVLVQSKSLKRGDPAFRATVGDVRHRLDAVDGVRKIREDSVSDDGHSVLVTFEIPGTTDDTAVDAAVDETVAAVDAAAAAHRGFRVEQ